MSKPNLEVGGARRWQVERSMEPADHIGPESADQRDASAPPPPNSDGARHGGWSGRLHAYRRALSSLGFSRLLDRGELGGPHRLPRYRAVAAIGLLLIWLPIILYMVAAPKKYTSQATLILPGAGVSTSVNLSDIGQSTSSANSAYASTTLSPSVTYKNLLESDGVIDAAAHSIDLEGPAFGKPKIKLVDETSLINIKMTGSSPHQARLKTLALLIAFDQQLDHLRDGEISQRDASAAKTIKTYQAQEEAIRGQINDLELKSGLTSAEQYAAIVSATENLQTQVAETRAALKQKEGNVASLSDLLHVSPEVAALTLKVQADEETAALTEAVSKAAAGAAELEKEYGPNHPKYLEAEAQEAGARARLTARARAISGLTADRLHLDVDTSPKGERPALLARLVNGVVEREGLAAELSAQTAELETRRRRIHDLETIGSRLDALNRDYKIADAVFASALARVNSAKADQFASYPMVQVLEAATLPTRPTSPNRTIAIAAGLAASLLLGLALSISWVRRPLIERIVSTITRQGLETET